MRVVDPPQHFDGSAPVLDRSWSRVDRFARQPAHVATGVANSAMPHNRQDETTHRVDISSAGRQDRDTGDAGDRGDRGDLTSQDRQDRASRSDSESEQEDDSEGGPSTDSEWEYEDLAPELVVFDLTLTSTESHRLLQSTSRKSWSVTGLETSSPLLKVGNVTFMGKWEETVGTAIVLQDQRDTNRPFPHQHHPGPLARPLPSTTHDVIRFRQAYKKGVAQSQAQARFEDAAASIEAAANAKGESSGKGRDRQVREEGPRSRSEHQEGEVATADVDGSGEGEDKLPDDERSEDGNATSTVTASRGTSKRGRGRAPASAAQRVQRAIDRALMGDRELTKRAQKIKQEREEEQLQQRLRGESQAGPSGERNNELNEDNGERAEPRRATTVQDDAVTRQLLLEVEQLKRGRRLDLLNENSSGDSIEGNTSSRPRGARSAAAPQLEGGEKSTSGPRLSAKGKRLGRPPKARLETEPTSSGLLGRSDQGSRRARDTDADTELAGPGEPSGGGSGGGGSVEEQPATETQESTER